MDRGGMRYRIWAVFLAVTAAIVLWGQGNAQAEGPAPMQTNTNLICQAGICRVCPGLESRPARLLRAEAAYVPCNLFAEQQEEALFLVPVVDGFGPMPYRAEAAEGPTGPGGGKQTSLIALSLGGHAPPGANHNSRDVKE